jgi:hypothetical protein
MKVSNIQINLEKDVQKKYCGRSVLYVIYDLLKEIPENEEKLTEEILNYCQTLWNKAPELLISSECWFPLQCILSKHILDFDNEWKLKVLAVFNGVQ